MSWQRATSAHIDSHSSPFIFLSKPPNPDNLRLKLFFNIEDTDREFRRLSGYYAHRPDSDTDTYSLKINVVRDQPKQIGHDSNDKSDE